MLSQDNKTIHGKGRHIAGYMAVVEQEGYWKFAEVLEGMEKHGDGRPKTVATSDGSDLTWEDLGLVRQQSTDGTGYIKGLPVQWAIAPVA